MSVFRPSLEALMMCKNAGGLIAAFVMLLSVLGCHGQVAPRELRDLEWLSQDLTAYIPTDRQQVRLLPVARQKQLAIDFLRRFLAPWQPAWTGRSQEELFGNRDWLLENSLYGGNGRLLPMSLRRQWLALCAVDSFPNADDPAITLRATDLRGLPTRQPAFYDFSLPGEGYPFDYLQYSAIAAATPVRIRQRSADGCWLLVETDAMFGWLPSTDVAVIGAQVEKQVRSSDWCVMIKDHVPLTGPHGAVLAIAGLGSIWAQAEPGKVWAAVRGDDGRARLCAVSFPAAAAGTFPLPLTPATMAETGNRLLGDPYDWGGQIGARDCSSTLRDLFACFGIYLPRNSEAQARAGQALDLRSVATGERSREILKWARPWLTLAYMPGHIMLYVGEFEGQPVFLHTLWGLKTADRGGREGRYPVGRTVLTGLFPGDELERIKRPEGLLGERLEKLVLLGGPKGDNLPAGQR